MELEAPFYIALIRSDDHIAVLANPDDDGSIAVKQNCEDWTHEFENMYAQAHMRSYESSMSACLNFMMMQPSFVAVDSIEDITKRVLDPATAQLMSFRSIAGGFRGIVSDLDIQHLWDAGIKPQLTPTT